MEGGKMESIMELRIEKASMRDVPEIAELYEQARSFMAENGNPGQWTGGYPTREDIISDIELSQLYVARPASGNRNIACVFVFFIGLDPSYFSIEGAWLNNAEYGVIHRIATAKWARGRGAAACCIEHCFRLWGNVRIDTHEDNIPMQHLIEKCGFKRCGIVHMASDGSPRIAYQRCADLILASNSPRRRELMQKLSRPFYVDPAAGEERLPEHIATADAAEYLAMQKAREVYELHQKEELITVVGSDTVVLLDGEIFGKPKDEADAKRMLRALSGRTHEVRTGVCVMDRSGCKSFTSVSEVSFYELSDEDIDYYVSTGEPMDKAGAYGIQDEGALLISSIKGDYYTIMGLPVAELNRKLNGSKIFYRI